MRVKKLSLWVRPLVSFVGQAEGWAWKHEWTTSRSILVSVMILRQRLRWVIPDQYLLPVVQTATLAIVLDRQCQQNSGLEVRHNDIALDLFKITSFDQLAEWQAQYRPTFSLGWVRDRLPVMGIANTGVWWKQRSTLVQWEPFPMWHNHIMTLYGRGPYTASVIRTSIVCV